MRLLLAYYSVRTAVEDRAHGWFTNDVPRHPKLLSTVYMVAACCLVVTAARLLGTGRTNEILAKTEGWRRWVNCFLRLGVCIASSLIATFLLAYLIMAAADS